MSLVLQYFWDFWSHFLSLWTALALNINIGSDFYPTYFVRPSVLCPTQISITHLNTMFIECLCVLGIILPAGERVTRQRKSLPSWSLHCSGEVSFRLLCNKLPQNIATSNIYLLSHSSWGWAGGLWFRVTRRQSVSWGCSLLKAKLGGDLTHSCSCL